MSRQAKSQQTGLRFQRGAGQWGRGPIDTAMSRQAKSQQTGLRFQRGAGRWGRGPIDTAMSRQAKSQQTTNGNKVAFRGLA